MRLQSSNAGSTEELFPDIIANTDILTWQYVLSSFLCQSWSGHGRNLTGSKIAPLPLKHLPFPGTSPGSAPPGSAPALALLLFSAKLLGRAHCPLPCCSSSSPPRFPKTLLRASARRLHLRFPNGSYRERAGPGLHPYLDATSSCSNGFPPNCC